MMRWITAFALLFALPHAGASQTPGLVRSAEHPDFSRVVVPVEPGTKWEFTIAGREARLVVPGNTNGFDVTTVFDRIPKTRLRKLVSQTEKDGSSILFSLACPCDTQAAVSGRYVIIEIHDPGSIEGSPAQEALQSANDQLAAVPALSTSVPASPRPVTNAPKNGSKDVVQEPAKSSERTGPAQVEAEPAGTTPEASEVADMLIEQLERAADQGLVELQPKAPPKPSDTALEPDRRVQPSNQTALQPYDEDIDGMDGLANRLERAIDDIGLSDLSDAIRLQVPKERIAPQPIPTNTGSKDSALPKNRPAHCLEDYHFDFSVLDAERAPINQITELRSKLIGEFDNPDGTKALALAKVYIALGMGIEARAISKEFLSDAEQRDLLTELAQVVEGKEPTIGGHLDNAAGCPGPAAIWRTAAITTNEMQPVPDAPDIVGALGDLPVNLRRRLVPRIVSSFINRGQIAEAEESFAILDRAPGDHGSEHELQRARLLALSGQDIEAEDVFARLARENSPTAPDALVALVESLVARDQRVPDHVIGDTADLARQLRGDPTSKRLRQAEIKAKAGNGRLGEALEVIAAQISEVPDLAPEYLSVADGLLSANYGDALTPGEYAKAIFDHQELLTEQQVSPKARHTVALELIRIGLPEAAIAVAEHDARRPITNAETREIHQAANRTLAQAYLALDKPEMVLEILPNTANSPEESALRIAALTKLGRHEAALAVAEHAGQNDDLASLGFRAGDWGRAASATETLNGALARYMLRREGPDDAIAEIAEDPELVAVEMPAYDIDDVSLQAAEKVRSQASSIRKALGAVLDGPS